MRYLVQRGSGPARPALHPDKRTALADILVAAQKTTQKRQAKSRPGTQPVRAGQAQGLASVLYRMHDPSYRYFGREGRTIG
jgi:hypothetical protein